MASSSASSPSSSTNSPTTSSSASRNNPTVSISAKSITLSENEVKMIADTIKTMFKYSAAAPAAPEASDADFNIVARSQGIGHNNVVKVKGDSGEAATERLANTTAAATERLANTAAAATERLTTTAATASAIATTPFILGGLGGLAI